MLIQSAVYLPTILSLFVIGVFVYIKNPNGKINRIFSIFIASMMLWQISLYLADISDQSDQALTFVRLALFFSTLLPYLFLQFSRVFPEGKTFPLKLSALLAVPTAILAPLSLGDHFVTSVKIGEYVAEPDMLGPLFTYYSAYLVLYFLAAVILLIYKYRKSKAVYRSQIKLLLLGMAVAISVNIFANVFLVSIDQAAVVALFGGPSVLVMVVMVAYAIVKHRLFDIRGIVAKAVSYVLLVGLLGIAYGFAVFALSSTFLEEGASISAAYQIAIVAIAIFLAFSFQWLRDLVDMITKRVFFRNSYDPQTFIDQLNKTLVSSVELEELVTNSADVIQENLNTSFCTFFIRSTSYFPDRIIGQQEINRNTVDMERIQELASRLGTKIHYVVDDSSNPEVRELNSLLRKNDIDLLARLVSTLDYEVKGIGYIFMGSKKGGNLYTEQDTKVMEIVANELVLAVENALKFEEIEGFNVTLQKKIDDATRELQKSNEKLKALDEAKDEFVSMASHQLRTPLTSIKGYVSMVFEEDVGKLNDEQKKMLGQALFSSQRMVYLISDLLNVSRLKTGKFIIESKSVYLPDVVESELEQLKEGAEAKNITLVFSKPKEFPTLQLDEMKIRQVIMNLTDNAIYYTPTGGKINLELKDKDSTVEFTVKDNGIGVPKSERHKLFTKFYRADNARKARPDGTGLGLFMVKKVIVAQGGSVIFESEEGKGSTFGFSLNKQKLLDKKADE